MKPRGIEAAREGFAVFLKRLLLFCMRWCVVCTHPERERLSSLIVVSTWISDMSVITRVRRPMHWLRRPPIVYHTMHEIDEITILPLDFNTIPELVLT